MTARKPAKKAAPAKKAPPYADQPRKETSQSKRITELAAEVRALRETVDSYEPVIRLIKAQVTKALISNPQVQDRLADELLRRAADGQLNGSSAPVSG